MFPETVSDYETNYITGWIKIYRSIRSHWIFENEKYFKAWITMIFEVNFEDKKVLIGGELIECKRGQSVYSIETWVKKFGKGWSTQKIRTFFKLLQKDNMIIREGLRKTTRLTIINYDTYQNGQLTANSQLTHSQLTDNSQITTTKELKNIKNDKNTYSSSAYFEKIWKQYPDKVGKRAALRHYSASVKTEQDFRDIQTALETYKCSRRVGRGFIQNGSTWFNNWRDWLDYEEPKIEQITDEQIDIKKHNEEVLKKWGVV